MNEKQKNDEVCDFNSERDKQNRLRSFRHRESADPERDADRHAEQFAKALREGLKNLSHA